MRRASRTLAMCHGTLLFRSLHLQLLEEGLAGLWIRLELWSICVLSYRDGRHVGRSLLEENR